MPKYDQIKFGERKFGTSGRIKALGKICFRGVPLGFAVRGQIAKKIIYRVRHGNGYAGTELNEIIHDKYKYFVPKSINNAAGAPARNAFKQAMYNWYNVLSQEEKNKWIKKTKNKKAIFGWNLYIRDYIKNTL